MNCPKCGKDVMDGYTVCSNCGTMMPEQPVAEPAYTETPAVPERKVGKMRYLLTKAPVGVRVAGILCWVLTFVALGVLAMSYQAVIHTSYDAIPIVSTLLPEEIKVQTDEYEAVLSEAIGELEGYIDQSEDLTAEQEQALDQLLEAAKELDGDITLNNINGVVNEFDNVFELEYGKTEMGELTGAFDMAETVSLVMDILMLALLVLVVFCGIWTFFGGVFRINGLIVTGMIFTMLYALPLCSMVYTGALLALNVVLIVLASIATSSYKRYRRS